MICESAIAKASLSGLSKALRGAASSIGKQVLDSKVKQALDQSLSTQIQTSLCNISILEQSLFALDLSGSEEQDLEEFFNSGVFEGFIKSLCVVCEADGGAIPAQQEALSSYLIRTLPNKSLGATQALAAALTEFIEKASLDAWEMATQTGLFGQSWKSEAAIQALVSDHLANAQRQIEQRIASTSASLKDIENFVERYKRQIRHATSKLRPQSLNDGPSVPVDDLYVEPLVIPISDKNLPACPRGTMLAASRRAVLLGNPGGGKSTLANKLCYDICSGALDHSDPEVPFLAALVVLRDYAQYQKTSPCSIVEYLEMHSKSEYQVDAPDGAFKLLMLSGRILVVFDGLDELIETKDRIAVRSAVEHFAIEYPVAPVLVTSREVGYEQAPLDRGQFNHYKLSPFTDEQMQSYANNWFRYSCAPNIEEGKKLANAFVKESGIVPDIRSNPLMLGLLCNLYRQDGFLPKNRPEVYQRCADLLFTKWDRGRGIHIKLPLDHRLRPAMSYLAHWIYSDESLQTGVTESRLTQATSDYLRQWVEDDAEADQIASEFIAFFSGRAWVFTDVGADRTQNLYQFTHRTFLEYFTADELVRLYPKAEDLHAHLIGKIKSRSWDVVCQLAYQITVQRTLSHNVLVDLLCNEARNADLRERLNVLSFLSRTMDLLYPMPPARREAVRLCAETVFRDLSEIERGGEEFTALALEILAGVLGTSDEVLKINGSQLSSTVMELLSSARAPEKVKGDILVLVDDLSVAWRMSTESFFTEDRSRFWDDQSRVISIQTSQLRSTLANSDFRVALLNWWRGETDVYRLSELYGGKVLFKSVNFPYGNWFRTPIANVLVDWCMDSEMFARKELSDENQRSRDLVLSEASKIGAMLVDLQPWAMEKGEPFLLPPFHSLYRLENDKRLRWPDEAKLCEAVLICLAVICENEAGNPGFRNDVVGTLSDLTSFYLSPSQPDHRRRAHEVVDERCRSPKVNARLHRWVDANEKFTFNLERTS